MERIHLKSPAGSMEVTPYAAHLCSWKNAKGEELLFMSSKAIFEPPKAIRGGVPVCFPQFGPFGPLGQHGFARNQHFEVEQADEAVVTLLLKYDGSQADYPFPFELRVRVALCDETFLQTLQVKNTGTEPMPFTCALHTYYRVSAIEAVTVEGLQGVEYLDSLQGRARKTEDSSAITFGGEVDRIYLNAPSPVKICDAASGRTIEVSKQGFPDAVLWNPWIEKSRGMADLGDDDYKHFVCLEPAVAATGPVVLQPGESWEASQSVSVAEAADA